MVNLWKHMQKSIFYNNYKLYRHKLNHLIWFSKKHYYLNYFDIFKHNMRKTWQGIKNLVNMSMPKFKGYSLQDGSSLITNLHKIADKFNLYFNKIASNIVSKMKPAKKSHKDYLQKCINGCFFVTPPNYFTQNQRSHSFILIQIKALVFTTSQ